MLRLGKVVTAHPEDHSVDLLMLDTADRLPGVQVLSGFAGTDFGCAMMAEPDKVSPDDVWSPRDTKTRDILAVVGQIGPSFVVLGFLFPQVAQALFQRLNFAVNRHPSDVYTTVDNDGNVEVSHPSGTFIRIAVNPAHEDLTGQDFDKIWAIKKNTDKAVAVRIEVRQGGARKSTWTMFPDGKVTLDATSDVLLKTPSKLTVDAPDSFFLGKVTISGLITYLAGMSGTGGATVSGSVAVSGGDVTADGISLKTHRHGGVQTGGGQTGTPV